MLSECQNFRNFPRGTTGPLPVQWKGWEDSYHGPPSTLAVPLDAPSLHSGAVLHLAQSQSTCVRIFWVVRLRPLVGATLLSSATSAHEQDSH